MSETALFILGALVFAITVYGVVMAGGLVLTRHELEQNEDRMRAAEQDDPDARIHVNVRY